MGEGSFGIGAFQKVGVFDERAVCAEGGVAGTEVLDPAAPGALHGIVGYTDYYKNNLPAFEFSLGASQIPVGNFMLTPNCVNIGGKTCVVYYTATLYNSNDPEKDTNAYFVGPDAVQKFIANAAIYEKN